MALIPKAFSCSSKDNSPCRNGAPARKGIDTLDQLSVFLKVFFCRNGALARKGIDTNLWLFLCILSALSRNGAIARKGIDTVI